MLNSKLNDIDRVEYIGGKQIKSKKCYGYQRQIGSINGEDYTYSNNMQWLTSTMQHVPILLRVMNLIK